LGISALLLGLVLNAADMVCYARATRQHRAGRRATLLCCTLINLLKATHPDPRWW
jgi:hypothetical protein